MRILVIARAGNDVRPMKVTLKNHLIASVGMGKAEELLARSRFDLLIIHSTIEKPEDGHELAKKIYSANSEQKLLVLRDRELKVQKGIYYFHKDVWNDDIMQEVVDTIFGRKSGE